MNTATRVAAGLLVFVIAAFFRVPHLLHPAWAHALLGFAALVLAPLLFDLIGDDDADDAWGRRGMAVLKKAQLPAAALLVVACALSPGVMAAVGALPWAGVLLALAAIGLRRIIRRGWRPMSRLCRDVGLIYAAVAALWLLEDRAGLHPLGFDEAIVLLTAVHFHYAGLLLPVLAGLALQKFQSAAAAVVGVAVIAGVPGVAAGITAAQLGLGHTVEMGAALLMAIGGAGVAWLQLRLAFQPREPVLARCLWVASSASLIAGMALAALYGLRFFFQPWPWLAIPWMRALHGSLNALGFGFPGVLAWWIAGRGLFSARENAGSVDSQSR